LTDLSGKVVLVTGASRGIGKAIAGSMAAHGALLAVNNMDLETARSAADDIIASGGAALAVCADVTDGEAVNGMIDTIVAHYGRLDVLVNNAGITRDQLLIRMSDDDWDRVLSVNLKGAFLCTRAALRPMIKNRWGRIISIASIVGITGNAGQANYAASKAGLIGFTRSVAREVASRGITANAIAPGFIDTDMTMALSEDQRSEITARIPLGCLGQPGDVAGLAAFLASDEARYITGQVICIDGGLGSA
jgi:3-oxoacyl-[acyl-carrier protein] reductase